MFYLVQNVQYQETDQNQINKLPTWGILFDSKTLTNEVNKIIQDNYLQNKSMSNFTHNNLIICQQKDKQKEKCYM